MPLVVECPSCGKKLKVPDTLVGRQVRCADCAGTFVAEKPQSAPPPLPPSPPQREEEDDDDFDRDRRRSRRRRSGGAPHRGGMILAFGIVSLVGSFSGLFIIGLPLGILAWIWGGKDLKQMEAGQMDREGRSNTHTGYILGIIGTIINLLATLAACAYVIFIVVIIGMVSSKAASFPTGPMPPPRIPAPPPQQPKKDKNQPGRTSKVADYLPGRAYA